MHGITKKQVKSLIKFDPEQAKFSIETLAAAIDVASKMQEWEACKDAAYQMVQWQAGFVAWWKVNVSPGESPGDNQYKKRSVADRGPTKISAAQAQKQTKIKKQQVSRWNNALKRPDYAARIFQAAYIKAMTDKARRADLQTGEMEWYTPSFYIEKARPVLGDIDLDPASCALAQKIIKAKNYFTEKENGLEQNWKGRIWLNPPYAGKLVATFATKMIEQIKCGNVTAAIMLTNAYTETSWFHNLASISEAICFTRGRIKFESPHGEKCSPTNGQSFFYFGPNRQKFSAEFGDVGIILVRP